jgi:hypothetical protein
MKNLFIVLDEGERPLACFWDLFNPLHRKRLFAGFANEDAGKRIPSRPDRHKLNVA